MKQILFEAEGMMEKMKRALSGVKVVEFTWFAAGPVIAKYLADYGAEVVHVESKTRPDGFRTYMPFKDNIPGVDRSIYFAVCNSNKYGITLNLKNPRGNELAKKLVRWADIVTENMTPGSMGRLGLGYDDLKKVNPEIIMLSTCNQGQTGPHASQPGFGTHLTNLSGFSHLTGWPDRTPINVVGPYIDFISVAFATSVLIAALDYRRRTGKGQYIDISQYETGAQFIAAALLDYGVNGKVACRMGNQASYAAPHGAYPCKGDDSWCIISVFSDEEWFKLRELMGIPDLASLQFDTVLGRKQNEDEVDRLIGTWTSQYTAKEVFDKLQGEGLRAGIVYNGRDYFEDPQMKIYSWREKEHPVIGKHTYFVAPFRLSKTPAEIRTPGHLLGEHNEYVFTRILGLSKQELTELASQECFD